MINSKKLKLTIVIPVFNEEDYLGDCLASIAAQSERPDEVIVVDNNSTDRSMQIAEKFSFVKIIHEPRQHQSFAQKTGFDAAAGDIIGRIDADTILPKDWVKTVKQKFTSDPEVVGITGSAWPYDVQFKQLAIAVFEFYNKLASLIAGSRMIWGANCAIRNSAWRKISRQVLQRRDIWEDFDMAMLLAKYGRIDFLPSLRVGVSFRAVHKSFLTQFSYQFRSIRTFYLRRGFFRAVTFLVVWYTMAVFYPLALLDEHVLKPFASLRTRRRQVLESGAIVD